MMIPGALMRRSLKQPERCTSIAMDSSRGSGRMLQFCITSLRDALEDLDNASLASIQSAVVEMICTTVHATPNLSSVAPILNASQSHGI